MCTNKLIRKKLSVEGQRLKFANPVVILGRSAKARLLPARGTILVRWLCLSKNQGANEEHPAEMDKGDQNEQFHCQSSGEDFGQPQRLDRKSPIVHPR